MTSVVSVTCRNYFVCNFLAKTDVFRLLVCEKKKRAGKWTVLLDKALTNEDTLLRTHFCSWFFLGAQTRGTLNECCVSMLRQLGNICCWHNVSEKIRNIFCVPDTKFAYATNVARAGKRGNICVGKNVSSFARALSRMKLNGFRVYSTWSVCLAFLFI